MTGSGPALYGTLLDSADLADVVARARSVQTVLTVGQHREGSPGSRREPTPPGPPTLAAAAGDRVVVAEQVRARWTEVAALLAAQEGELVALRERAGALDAAEAAAARAAEARAEAALASFAAAAAGGTARAQPVPAAYQDLYVRAAATCPGMSPALLSAVGQVESGHGVNLGPSSAGAVGPMQFLPGTFASFGVDGDGDGDKDVFDPADSIFSAANYLCSGGGGGDRAAVSRALFRYNHAQWYVTLVLGIADQLGGRAVWRPDPGRSGLGVGQRAGARRSHRGCGDGRGRRRRRRDRARGRTRGWHWWFANPRPTGDPPSPRCP